MTIQEMMSTADSLATELIQMAQNRGIPKEEFLQIVAMTERLLHKVVTNDDADEVRQALDCADAIWKAATEELCSN